MRKKENFKNLVSDTMDNDQRRGFTMVELIVVLVILAILAAVAIPALLGFIDNAREKQYIADAEASLKATQSALTEVYNNASNRVHPDRRKVAHEESGTGINTSFKVWTVNNLQDGETAAIADNIASYTVAYALFTAEDGTRVFYNGKSWELCKAGEDISDLAGYGDFVNENVIYMWDYQSDTAYDPNRNPDYENNQFAEDVIIDSATGLRIRFMGDGKLTFSKDGSDNDETYVDYYADSTDYETSDAQIAALAGKLAAFELKIMEIFKPDSLKWTCTVGEETFILDSYAAAIKNAVELYNTDKVADGEVIYKAVLEGDTISFTARFAPYDPKIQLVNGGDVAAYVFTYDAATGEITYGEGNNKVNIDDMDLNSLISGSQNTANVPENGAVEYSERWLLYTGSDTEGEKEYEMQEGAYKEYSLKDSETNNAKAYIKTSIEALVSGSSDVDNVTFETPANLCKTVHYKAYTDNISTDSDGNISDDDFDPDGSSKEESNKVTFNGAETVSVDYHKNEIDTAVRDENDTVINVDYTDYDSDDDGLVDVAYDSYGVEGYSNPVTWEKVKRGERFKFWLISDSDKEGNIDENDPNQIKARPKGNSSDDQRDCLNVILARLFAEGNYHFGQVAELDLSDINALLINNGDVDITAADSNIRNQTCVLRNEFNKLVGNNTYNGTFSSTETNNVNSKIKSIQYVTQAQAAEIRDECKSNNISVNQKCISTTKLAGTNLSLQGWDTFDFTITEEDKNYPAYVVAFAVPVEGNNALYDVYVFSEDDCYIKAKSTFQGCFYGFNEMEENTLVSHLDTSEVIRLKLMFCNCKKLKNLDISNVSAKNTTDTTGMFANCLELEELHIENINTVGVRYYQNMFLNCKSLYDVYTVDNMDGGGHKSGYLYLDIDSAYDLDSLFKGCESLTSVTLSGNPGGLTPLGLGYNRNIGVERAGDDGIKNIFADCTGIEEIHLTDIKLEDREGKPIIDDKGTHPTKISNIKNLLPAQREKLKRVKIDKCSFPNVLSLNSLFKDNTVLEYIDISDLELNNQGDVDGSSMFENCSHLTGSEDFNINGKFYYSNTALMFKNCNQLENINSYSVDTTKATTMNSMFENCSEIDGEQTIRIDSASNINYLFKGCSKLDKIIFKGGTDGCNAALTSYNEVLAGCTELTSIEVSDLVSDTNTNGFKGLFSLYNGRNFASYESVSDFKISGCTFSELESFNNLFAKNTIIESFIMENSSFDKLTGMKEMFSKCTNLTSVKFDNVTTSNAGVDGTSMFEGCTQSNFTGVNVADFKLDGGFDFINTSRMFFGCTSLTTAVPYNINTSKVIAMEDMFNGCTGLVNINVSELNTGNVTTMKNMFYGCSNIRQITMGGAFNTSKVEYMNGMFQNCSNLETINGANDHLVAGLSLKTVENMFNECRHLTGLDLRGFKSCNNLTTIEGWFYNCRKLDYILLNNFSTSESLGNIKGAFCYVGYENPKTPTSSTSLNGISGCKVFASGKWNTSSDVVTNANMDNYFRLNLYGTVYKNAGSNNKPASIAGATFQGNAAHLDVVLQSDVPNQTYGTGDSRRAWVGYFMDANSTYYQTWYNNKFGN